MRKGEVVLRLQNSELNGLRTIEMDSVSERQNYISNQDISSELQSVGIANRFSHFKAFSHLKRGVLRGLHYHRVPQQTESLIRVTRGSAFFVFVDLRSDSKTFLKWQGIHSASHEYQLIHAGQGFASGFVVYETGTEIVYQHSTPIRLDAIQGLRYDDPSLHIRWPKVGSLIVSEADRSLPPFQYPKKAA